MLMDRVDEDLLEFVALSEPWSMVCGEFYSRYGSIEALVARLITFNEAEFLRIEPDSGAPAVSAGALLTDAAEHECYEDIVVSESPGWTITATDKGFAAVRERLREQ